MDEKFLRDKISRLDKVFAQNRAQQKREARMRAALEACEPIIAAMELQASFCKLCFADRGLPHEPACKLGLARALLDAAMEGD